MARSWVFRGRSVAREATVQLIIKKSGRVNMLRKGMRTVPLRMGS